ncbi:MAG: hypothetical protein ACI8Z1_001539 [Candidatus Azotimanducaceae bacterium]|jgi:hypothetical protein
MAQSLAQQWCVVSLSGRQRLLPNECFSLPSARFSCVIVQPAGWASSFSGATAGDYLGQKAFITCGSPTCGEIGKDLRPTDDESWLGTLTTPTLRIVCELRQHSRGLLHTINNGAGKNEVAAKFLRVLHLYSAKEYCIDSDAVY